MKIEQIEISGLRSHRGDPPTVVDLTDKSLVAIVGPTGAGKSSLLEAICFALYGEATFGGKAYKELSSDGCSEISVRMTFSVGEDKYQLVRTVAPNRSGVFGAKATWLRQVDDAGNALMQFDQVRKVDAAVRNLLGGMDRVQFCQAVLLAQNRYAELLEVDERKRLELLDILLGLTALADARKALHTTDKAVQRNMERLSDRRADLPVDPAATAKEAADRSTAMTQLAERARAGADMLKTLVEKAADLAGQVRSLEEAAALRVAGADGYERLVALGMTLKDLVTAEKRISGEIGTAQKAKDDAASALGGAQKALEAVEKEHGKAGSHDVVTQQLGELGRLLNDQLEQECLQAQADEAIKALNVELAAAQGALAAASAGLTETQEAERLAKDSAQQAVTALSSREQDLIAARELSEQFTGLATDLDTALAGLVDADQVRTTATDAARGAGTNCEAAVKALKEAQQASSAAAAAHDHHPGDPCPVCQRTLPEGWTPPASADLTQASAAEEKAKQALEKASSAQRKAGESRGRLAGVFMGVATSLVSKHGELAKAAETRGLPLPPQFQAPDLSDDVPVAQARALTEQVGELLQPLSAWGAGLGTLLTPLQEARDRAERAAAGAEIKRTEAESAAKVATDTQVEINTRKATAEEGHRNAVAALAAAKNHIQDLRTRIPERCAALVPPGADEPVKEALAAVAADKQVVGDALEARDVARQSLQTATEHVVTLEAEKTRTVEVPFAAAKGTLQDLSSAIGTLADKVEQPGPAPIPESATPTEALEAAGALRTIADTGRSAAQTRITTLQAENAALAGPARSAVEELLVLKAQADPEGLRIEASPNPDAPLQASTFEVVQQLVGAANTAASTAQAEAARAKAQVQTAKELDVRLGALGKWRADLAGALVVLKKENFPAWARDQRIAELVETASELLSQMTGGRYRFDNHLRISDEVAGATRSATTLSGGEKFEAALALALGVAEIAGRSGIRFDTLFLDEGFAGLDQPNLDRALDALETEVENGRRVVLITHMGSVADRIKDVLYIEPDGQGGSKTRWLNEEERYELGADLDLTEVAGGR
jgi:exonuclease SbcC